MATRVTTHEFTDGLVNEFAIALESVIGTPVSTAAGTAIEHAGWIVPLTLSGDLRGLLSVWIGVEDAASVAKRVMGLEEAPDDATVADMLREMWTQATSALALKSPFTGVKAGMADLVKAELSVDPIAGYVVGVAEGSGIRLAMWGEITQAPPAPPPAAIVPSHAPVVDGAANAKLEVVLEIDLPLVVRFGQTTMSLKALAALGPGSIVEMGRLPDEPVDMLIGEQVIARGEVVIVAGNYGVRITDLVGSAERIRALEV